MNIKRLISSVLCGTLLAATLSMSAFALTFPDVEDDPTVSWAKDSINQMTDKGYIKGYEDGTFKPTRPVSKVETLILMSRVLGVNDSDFSEIADLAKTAYSTTVSAINTTYVNELSYLMYFDVLDIANLRDYASAANANVPLFRWQAAYLMTKLAVGDVEASDYELDKNLYSDYNEIPESARPYVAYATDSKLMNGMGQDDNGKDHFSPLTTLTRAQMATLLNRMISQMDKKIYEGTVTSVNSSSQTVTVNIGNAEKTFDIDSSTIIRANGEDARFSAITADSDIKVTTTFGNARMIDVVPSQEKTTIFGIIVQTSDNSNGQQVTIKDYEDETNKATYTFATNCKITDNGSKSAFGDLKANNFVRLVLAGSQITECNVEAKSSTIYGSFVDAFSDDDNHTYITVVPDDSKTEITYDVSSAGLIVKRNGLSANLRDLANGDDVEVFLKYGKVVEIEASSKTTKVTGTIKEIILSDSPTITLIVENKSQTYSLTSSTVVKVNDVDGTIYDLRPNNAATVQLDGTNVAKIESSATSSTGKTTVSGKVTSINTTLKVITVSNDNGSTDTVYYGGTTNFLKSSTGKSITAKDIVAGSTINATGTDATGYFVATIIIAD